MPIAPLTAVDVRGECERLAARHPGLVPVVLEASGTEGKLHFTALPPTATIRDLASAAGRVTGGGDGKQYTLTVAGCVPSACATLANLLARNVVEVPFLRVTYVAERQLGFHSAAPCVGSLPHTLGGPANANINADSHFASTGNDASTACAASGHDGGHGLVTSTTEYHATYGTDASGTPVGSGDSGDSNGQDSAGHNGGVGWHEGHGEFVANGRSSGTGGGAGHLGGVGGHGDICDVIFSCGKEVMEAVEGMAGGGHGGLCNVILTCGRESVEVVEALMGGGMGAMGGMLGGGMGGCGR